MKNPKIVFTRPYHAELQTTEMPDVPALRENEVLAEMDYTVVSGGTERACITGSPNTSQHFPMSLGYCGVGRVKAVGDRVSSVKPGDRVLVYHGIHARWNIRGEDEITKVEDDSLSSLEASFAIIASMGLGGVRKLELELGESAMVFGLGLLGMFSVQFLHLSGAYPLIAADLNEDRRKQALSLGADYAFDPADPDFVKHVMDVTGGKGVRAAVEVTGVSKAMRQALECSSFMGRIALLGCTRVSDTAIDYYQQVHRPGVRLIGAHNFVRPKHDSYPHHWTHHDDCRCILALTAAGKLNVKDMVSRVVSPADAEMIYDQLCNDPKFPLGTVFDWNLLGEEETPC